jgi:hypothetical protein
MELVRTYAVGMNMSAVRVIPISVTEVPFGPFGSDDVELLEVVGEMLGIFRTFVSVSGIIIN